MVQPLDFMNLRVQGDSFEKISRNMKAEWLRTAVTGAGFWLPVMSANFAVVPAQYRVRFIAAASACAAFSSSPPLKVD